MPPVCRALGTSGVSSARQGATRGLTGQGLLPDGILSQGSSRAGETFIRGAHEQVEESRCCS